MSQQKWFIGKMGREKQKKATNYWGKYFTNVHTFYPLHDA